MINRPRFSVCTTESVVQTFSTPKRVYNMANEEEKIDFLMN